MAEHKKQSTTFSTWQQAPVVLAACLLLIIVLGSKFGVPEAIRGLLIAIALFLAYGFDIISAQLLGLEKRNVWAGLRLALPFAGIIIFVGAIALFLQPESFQDDRYNTRFSNLLFEVFISIPLFTVVLEELVFRGLIVGSFLQVLRQRITILLSALVFGMWHIFSAGGAEDVITDTTGSVPSAVIILGIVVATTIAGVFFAWLRVKSDSLVAPILVHWAINATGAVIAFASWHL